MEKKSWMKPHLLARLEANRKAQEPLKAKGLTDVWEDGAGGVGLQDTKLLEQEKAERERQSIISGEIDPYLDRSAHQFPLDKTSNDRAATIAVEEPVKRDPIYWENPPYQVGDVVMEWDYSLHKPKAIQGWVSVVVGSTDRKILKPDNYSRWMVAKGCVVVYQDLQSGFQTIYQPGTTINLKHIPIREIKASDEGKTLVWSPPDVPVKKLYPHQVKAIESLYSQGAHRGFRLGAELKIIGGRSGSGKSTLIREWVEKNGYTITLLPPSYLHLDVEVIKPDIQNSCVLCDEGHIVDTKSQFEKHVGWTLEEIARAFQPTFNCIVSESFVRKKLNLHTECLEWSLKDLNPEESVIEALRVAQDEENQ